VIVKYDNVWWDFDNVEEKIKDKKDGKR